jgi:hypothetical protein
LVLEAEGIEVGGRLEVGDGGDLAHEALYGLGVQDIGGIFESRNRVEGWKGTKGTLVLAKSLPPSPARKPRLRTARADQGWTRSRTSWLSAISTKVRPPGRGRPGHGRGRWLDAIVVIENDRGGSSEVQAGRK